MSGAPGLSGREATRLWLLQHEFVYRDDREALEDAHRLALLTAVSGAREDRERLRVRTVNALNRARDPLAPRVRGGGPGVDAAFVSAVVLVIVSVALMLVTAGSGPFEPGGGAGDAAAVWFGLLAVIGVGVLAWCDPLRARGEVWYTGTSTALHLVLAVLLLGAYAFCLIVNLPGIDGSPRSLRSAAVRCSSAPPCGCCDCGGAGGTTATSPCCRCAGWRSLRRACCAGSTPGAGSSTGPTSPPSTRRSTPGGARQRPRRSWRAREGSLRCGGRSCSSLSRIPGCRRRIARR